MASQTQSWGRRILLGFFTLIAISSQTLSANNQSFPKVKNIRAVTTGPKDHFTSAYYCNHSWSASQRYILSLETDINNRQPKPEDRATLGMIDLETEQFIPLADTGAWNYIHGALQQWLGSAPDSEIIYNDRRDGRFDTPLKYQRGPRCDLHARWNQTGDQIVFDSTHEGNRQVYVMDLEFE